MDSEENSPPWAYYYGCERLLNLGRQGIIVGEDGSKTVVKVPRSSTISTIFQPDWNDCADRRSPMNYSEEEELSSDSLDEDVLNGTQFEAKGTDQGPYYSTQNQKHSPRASVVEPLRHEQLTIVDGSNIPPPRGKTIKALRWNLSVVLSAIYCIFLVTVGVVIGVADLILPETNIGEIFSLYLLIPGLVWYVVLHVDLRRHNGLVIQKDRSAISISDDGYTFRRGRHSGSFFLKIGAAGFCFGHLIHSCLMLGRQILHFTSDDPTIKRDCADTTALILYLLLPVYSFYQLFILFKYSNVIINRWNVVARFALMHSMATSLFFWFWSVRNETVDSLHHRQLLRDHQSHQKSTTREDIVMMPYLMNLTRDGGEEENYTSNSLLRMLWNSSVLTAERCAEGSDFSSLLLHVSPYLYPFSIEYSILVVGIWFIMWQNVGKMEPSRSASDGSSSTSSRNNYERLLRNHLVIHADCSSANRGLFAGLVVMVATAVSIIVFFLAFSNRRYVATGILIGLVSESTLLILMVCAAGLACRQLATLDINANPVSQLDDLLLFICIPSFFLYGIFSIVPAMAYSNYMALFVAILQVLQVTLQTPTIIDGLRRCSYSETTQSAKPGRELITFLIVCNLSMWIMETLEIKSYETNRDRIHFYGHPLWTLLSHITLPLTLFYRFHSASCLVDIWKSAYEAPEH